MRTIKKNTCWRNFLACMIRYERFRMNPKHIDILIYEAQRAFQLGFVMLFMTFMLSCSGTKKLEKSDVKSNVKTEIWVQKNTEDKQHLQVASGSETSTDKKTDSSENTSKIKETKVTDYDPSKPIVPGTGKPPVMRETVTTEKEDTQKSDKTQETLNLKLNLQIDYNKQLKQKVDSQAKVISSLQSKWEIKEIPVIPWWKWILAGIVVGAVLTFLIYHFKWYVWFLNLIKKIIVLIRNIV